MGSNVSLGTFLPILLLSMFAVVLCEASGMGEYERLEDASIPDG